MRECPLCGDVKNETEFLGLHCSWCDKLVGNVQADLVAEFGPEANTV